jgi:hypothetical protein
MHVVSSVILVHLARVRVLVMNSRRHYENLQDCPYHRLEVPPVFPSYYLTRVQQSEKTLNLTLIVRSTRVDV